jgi:HPt (histidine-containing phosphotransfer) domain-containing protein
MESIIQFRPDEIVEFNISQLSILVNEMGPFAAEAMTAHAVATISERIGAVEAAWAASEFTTLGICARSLVGIAEQVGMSRVASVARDAAGLATGQDDVALAAVVHRLVRIGTGSLAAIGAGGALGP